MRELAAVLLATLLFLCACSRGEITREEWNGLSPEEKTVVVESLRGHEASRDAKGGFGRLHPNASAYYVEQIDARYNAGDRRSVTEIWEDLVEPKSDSEARPALPRA